MPEVGKVTPTLASSPTDPSMGFHPLISTLPEYDGLEVLTAPWSARTTKGTTVPNSGHMIASSWAAAKSCKNSMPSSPDLRPPRTSFHPSDA